MKPKITDSEVSGRGSADQGVLTRRMLAGAYVVLAALILYAWLQFAIRSPQRGWDFPMFYIAAHLPPHLLYHHPAFASFGQQYLVPLGLRYYQPFYIRPSVFAILYRPLAGLPYWQAFCLWAAVGLTAYLASVLVLMGRFRLPGFLLPAYVAFFPAIAGIITGQDVGTYLLVMLAGLLLLEKERDALAGLTFALCLYKFNLVILVPVMLLLHRRHRALRWFIGGGVLILSASILLAPPIEYLDVLLHGYKQIPGFFPVGLRGFSVAIHQPWCYPFLGALVLIVCCPMMRILPVAEAFCVAVTGTLLISPHLSWYDSTLLALPLAAIFGRGTTVARIACFGALVALPLWWRGGGNNGPIGFMHVGVEVLILAYFVHAALALTRIRSAPVLLGTDC